LQKNISIFKNLNETVQVIDKKTKEVLAVEENQDITQVPSKIIQGEKQCN